MGYSPPLLAKSGPGFWDFRAGAGRDLGYEVSASLILATKLSRGYSLHRESELGWSS